MVAVEANPAIRKSVDFRQLEEKEYRIFHVDGAFGGATPSGGLYIAFYTQVNAIPTETTHELTPSGTLGSVISAKLEHAIERRLQTGIVMDLNTTRSLVDWLTKQVTILEALQGQASQKGA